MTPRDPRIGIVGAGLSGVLMGMQLRRCGFDDFVIYDKQDDVGGTWLRNTYPGLHCDVPSHLYCYSFERNPDWSTAYASQPEIQAYLRGCAEKYDLVSKLRFGTSVDRASYDESRGEWQVETSSGERSTHRVLVTATGGLTEPNLPRIDGLDRFRGVSWHSGAWRHDVDLSGLRVAVIGTAASAVQVVPEVARHARRLTVFQRSPNWVMPRNNRPFTDAEREQLRDSDEQRRLWRKLYRRTLTNYRAFKRRPAAIRKVREVGVRHIHAAIEDPELRAAVTPAYEPGCRRIVVSDDYYPALAKSHVDLVTQGAKSLHPAGVESMDGHVTEVDCVIFCTGYKLGGRTDSGKALEVIGRGARTLRAVLAESPEAYRGAAVPGFPNYFTVCGVNGVAGYAPFFSSAELGTQFIVERTLELFDRGAKSIEAKQQPTRDYNAHIQAELQQMSWATGQCTNFYTDRTGRVVSFFPGTLARMRRELRQVGSGDFSIEPY